MSKVNQMADTAINELSTSTDLNVKSLLKTAYKLGYMAAQSQIMNVLSDEVSK